MRDIKSLYEKLTKYCSGDVYPFHMPGHKRNALLLDKAYSVDITEIDGFDNLHHPTGILKDIQNQMTKAYSSDKTYILVNGTTCGILTAISACAKAGDKVLVARNCHKSVYNALVMRGLIPEYLYPENDVDFVCSLSVTPESVDSVLQKENNIKAVIITSPTYEGVVSDITGIAKVVHKYNIPLIVDEAHGAHFSFGGGVFPKDGVSCGADVVVQSLHKTLPSLTQTAVLHIKSGLVDIRQIEFYLQVYQSSSPSYLLMSSAVEAVRYMLALNESEYKNYINSIKELRNDLEQIGNLKLLCKKDGVFDYDITRLVFYADNMTSENLCEYLREKRKIELEMCCPYYSIAISTVCDTEEGLKRLYNALKDAALIESKPVMRTTKPYAVNEKADIVMPPYDAYNRPYVTVPISECEGCVSHDTFYLYPPGVPLAVSGERITKSISDQLKTLENRGYTLNGTACEKGYINIIEEEK
ncbi:MAG: aminotransferase class I/II-fold pyridoxal phosphate-dependent enzyme [Clostridiales bacterium]|nr:aminotransferase class I/II-fold pyridoxal phosphate-dependent enzyme [Clostridiales bacterium]